MSNFHSGSSDNSGSDSDYDTQEGNTNTGTDIGSETGTSETPTSARFSRNDNENQDNANCFPSRSMAEWARGTYDPKKPLLLYATKVPHTNPPTNKRKKGGSRRWTCNVCSHPWVGSYSRVKQHLLGVGGKGVSICEKLNMLQRSELLRMQMAADARGTFSSQNVTSQEDLGVERKSKRKANPSTNMPPPSLAGASSSKRKDARSSAIGPTIIGMYSKLNRDDTDDAIGRFLFANGIPFHVSRSPYYKEMVHAIATAGPSYVLPGETKLRTSILEREVSKITMQKEVFKQTWVTFGCSIVMDGWTDIAKRPLINIIVTCRDGPYFLRAIDCSGKRKDATFQFELLRDAIEEVGPSNVVQVVIDAAAMCRSTGLLIQGRYKHIFGHLVVCMLSTMH